MHEKIYEIPIKYVDTRMSYNQKRLLDNRLSDILGYRVWHEEIMIAPRNRSEHELGKKLTDYFQVPNPIEYDTYELPYAYTLMERGKSFHPPISEESILTTGKNFDPISSFDTIDNTKKRVIRIVESSGEVQGFLAE